MKLQKIIKDGKEIFQCSCCEKEYNQIPFCFGSDYPDIYFSIPPEEIDQRIELNKSLCVIDEKFFYHRGQLEIPINDYSENLIFNVWTSISEGNFEKRMDDWNNPNRINNDPYFGWMQTQIPTYENSINIKTRAFEEDLDSIPRIEVTEENHQLVLDQENGISFEKAIGIIEFILDEGH